MGEEQIVFVMFIKVNSIFVIATSKLMNFIATKEFTIVATHVEFVHLMAIDLWFIFITIKEIVNYFIIIDEVNIFMRLTIHFYFKADMLVKVRNNTKLDNNGLDSEECLLELIMIINLYDKELRIE